MSCYQSGEIYLTVNGREASLRRCPRSHYPDLPLWTDDRQGGLLLTRSASGAGRTGDGGVRALALEAFSCRGCLEEDLLQILFFPSLLQTDHILKRNNHSSEHAQRSRRPPEWQWVFSEFPRRSGLGRVCGSRSTSVASPAAPLGAGLWAPQRERLPGPAPRTPRLGHIS